MSQYHLSDKECWEGEREEGRSSSNPHCWLAQQWTAHWVSESGSLTGRKRLVNKSNKQGKSREKGSKQVIHTATTMAGSPVYADDRDPQD